MHVFLESAFSLTARVTPEHGIFRLIAVVRFFNTTLELRWVNSICGAFGNHRGVAFTHIWNSITGTATSADVCIRHVWSNSELPTRIFSLICPD